MINAFMIINAVIEGIFVIPCKNLNHKLLKMSKALLTDIDVRPGVHLRKVLCDLPS